MVLDYDDDGLFVQDDPPGGEDDFSDDDTSIDNEFSDDDGGGDDSAGDEDDEMATIPVRKQVPQTQAKVFHSDNGTEVHVEVKNLPQKDIKVSVNKRILRVSIRPKPKMQGEWFDQSFPLPSNADGKNVKTTYSKGYLIIKVGVV